MHRNLNLEGNLLAHVDFQIKSTVLFFFFKLKSIFLYGDLTNIPHKFNPSFLSYYITHTHTMLKTHLENTSILCRINKTWCRGEKKLDCRPKKKKKKNPSLFIYFFSGRPLKESNTETPFTFHTMKNTQRLPYIKGK